MEALAGWVLLKLAGGRAHIRLQRHRFLQARSQLAEPNWIGESHWTKLMFRHGLFRLYACRIANLLKPTLEVV